MYTGIIDHLGEIKSLEVDGEGVIITVATEFKELVLGESIAVNGVCLTVNEITNQHFLAHLSPETLNLTNLQQLQVGDAVNLERSLCLGERMGGHIVQGHVDQTCVVSEVTSLTDYRRLSFTGIANNAKLYFIKKGSVAINGVSLTINNVTEEEFQCMIIPHTLSRTNLASLKTGDKVNIEYDWLLKAMLTQIEQRSQLVMGA